MDGPWCEIQYKNISYQASLATAIPSSLMLKQRQTNLNYVHSGKIYQVVFHKLTLGNHWCSLVCPQDDSWNENRSSKGFKFDTSGL